MKINSLGLMKPLMRRLPKIRQAAGPQARGYVFRQCVGCNKFQFIFAKRESRWFSGTAFESIRQAMREKLPDLAKKCDEFPKVMDEWCASCYQARVDRITSKHPSPFAPELIPKVRGEDKE